MFERVEARGQAAAERRVRARVAELAAHEAPAGVTVTGDGEQVAIEGRGLRRRLVTDARLRAWLP